MFLKVQARWKHLIPPTNAQPESIFPHQFSRSRLPQRDVNADFEHVLDSNISMAAWPIFFLGGAFWSLDRRGLVFLRMLHTGCFGKRRSGNWSDVITHHIHSPSSSSSSTAIREDARFPTGHGRICTVPMHDVRVCAVLTRISTIHVMPVRSSG